MCDGLKIKKEGEEIFFFGRKKTKALLPFLAVY
jgi:hypothetical protein